MCRDEHYLDSFPLLVEQELQGNEPFNVILELLFGLSNCLLLSEPAFRTTMQISTLLDSSSALVLKSPLVLGVACETTAFEI